MRDSCIALLSDFGSRDVYVAAMKGVIARIAPSARLIDLTHEIPPGDVRQAAFRLWQAFPAMPPGTIFLAVVDPGVGTSRKPVAVDCGGFVCVGPDNGIFTHLLRGFDDARVVEISRLHVLLKRSDQATSSTFHGRDVFAPAAALLAIGTGLTELGQHAPGLVSIPLPRLTHSERESTITGEALFADRFGNIATSIGTLVPAGTVLRLEPWLPGCPNVSLPSAHLRVRLGDGMEVSLLRTFSDVPPGAALAYVGSDGLLEVGVSRGRASDSLSIASGTEVSLTWR